VNALVAMWGGFLNDAKSAVGEIAASSSAAASSTAEATSQQLQTEAGQAVQATGLGAGAAVAPSGSSPKFVAWLAANWELIAILLGAWLLLRRPS